MFARRTHEIVETPTARGWDFEEVWVDVSGGRTHGWWLPLEGARRAVLFSHGSGRNISGYLEDAALYRAAGLSVLLYDYGGYGLSTGVPSEARCHADARAMWNHLTDVLGFAPGEIIIAGSSMGGGVACRLAAEVSPAALILESTFVSVPAVLREDYPFVPAWVLNRIRFDNWEQAIRLRCPVLVVHSREDAVVPFSQGRRLYERVAAPKMFVEIQGAHYGGKFTSRDRYLAGLREFLETCP